MRKVIVVGGSAGAIKALCRILKDIPAEFPAPILAVIHVPEQANALKRVLQRSTALTVVDSQKAEPIRAGTLYLAPPNRHLIVRSGCAAAVMGPRENRHRPAIDTLFRSAARAYRSSVIAVVLSGALDDGSAGALAVKSRGGSVIVQDPEDAEVPDMPANVIRQVKTDCCLTVSEIPEVLTKWAGRDGGGELAEASGQDCVEAAEAEPVAKDNEPVAFTCPDCGGALLQIKDANGMQFRCHVGHRFSMESFSEAQADAVERAVWIALRKLREREAIHLQLAENRSASPEMKRRYEENATAAARDIELLEQVLARM